MTIGRELNIPSNIALPPTLTQHELIKEGKEKHGRNLKVAKERMQMEMEKTKKRLDKSIVQKHSVYKPGDKIKTINKCKTNKLDSSWKGLYTIIDYVDHNNLRIRNKKP